MDNYPTLRIGVLHGLAGLKASYDVDPSYLRKADCPYDNDTVDLLERMFKPIEVEVIKEIVVEKPGAGKAGPKPKVARIGDDDAAELENEARELLKELRQLGKTPEGESDMKQLDTTSKLQIIKVQTQLMEKLVSIRERFSSVRKVSQFQATVINILDDLVPEDSRDEFMKRLEPYRA